ncbi:hypothetical protein [Curtobacterium sp. 9128]|uniref:hypothetical protein n=1 Tax=Curtobacterium sp. 9128 TaxID=1793722 RepID=UPI001642BAE4|nr:hypothetical protein [Curtobacterium sp. 9128]
MRRILAAAAVAVSAVAVIAGCSGTTSVAPTPVQSTDLTSSDGGFDQHAVIGVVLLPVDGSSSSGEALPDRFRTALTEAGFRPDVRVADTNDPAGSQRSAVHDLVRTGAKALLVAADDPASLTGELQTAHDAGVVVVGLGDQLPANGTGGDGVSADYRVATTGSDADLVHRAVAAVTSLQRGEKPDGD